jgi:hypothetical protein
VFYSVFQPLANFLKREKNVVRCVSLQELWHCLSQPFKTQLSNKPSHENSKTQRIVLKVTEYLNVNELVL